MQKGKVYTEGTPAFLPSSLTNIHPDALGFSPHPPVSVCGTDTYVRNHDAFLDTLGHSNWPCGLSPYLRLYNTLPVLRPTANIGTPDLPRVPDYGYSDVHIQSTIKLP